MPTEHFKSEEAYRKSRSYTHIHGIKTHAKDVVVAGKKHKVEHGTTLKSKGEGDHKRKRGNSAKEAKRKSAARKR